AISPATALPSVRAPSATKPRRSAKTAAQRVRTGARLIEMVFMPAPYQEASGGGVTGSGPFPVAARSPLAYASRYGRCHADPGRHRAGRPPRRGRPAPPRLRRTAQPRSRAPRRGEAGPDAPGHGPGPRSLPSARRQRFEPALGWPPSLLRGGRRGDAPHPHRSSPPQELPEGRGRPPQGGPERDRTDPRRTGPRTAGAGRCPPRARTDGPAEGRGRQARFFRRFDHGAGRAGARRFHLHRRKRLGLRAELAPPPDGGVGRRLARKRHSSRRTEKEFGVWAPLLALGSGG